MQRLVFFDEDAIGHATPDQASYEQLTSEESAASRARGLARAFAGVTFSASGAASEPGMSLKRKRQRLALVDVPAAVDGDVFHCERTCASMLHRAVLATRL